MIDSGKDNAGELKLYSSLFCRVRGWCSIIIQNLLIIRHNHILVQLFRYGIVGGLAFAVDFAVLVILTEVVELHYTISAAIAFTFGLVINYFLSIVWVFNVRSFHDKRFEFLLFGVIGLIGLALTELVLLVGTERFALDYRVSKILAVGLVFFWNFGARKFLLFNWSQNA